MIDRLENFLMLGAAAEGDLVCIGNQYFFDHGITAEIHAAAERGAEIIVVLDSTPDADTTFIQREAEKILEDINGYKAAEENYTWINSVPGLVRNPNESHNTSFRVPFDKDFVSARTLSDGRISARDDMPISSKIAGMTAD